MIGLKAAGSGFQRSAGRRSSLRLRSSLKPPCVPHKISEDVEGAVVFSSCKPLRLLSFKTSLCYICGHPGRGQAGGFKGEAHRPRPATTIGWNTPDVDGEAQAVAVSTRSRSCTSRRVWQNSG